MEKNPTLKKGSRGESVRELQRLLGITADGIFGKNTLAAVKEFQTKMGLYADGICGTLTWNALRTGEVPQNTRPPDFKQYDARWGSNLYTVTNSRAQTLRSGGCGPTAAADIVAAMFDSSVTPPDLAALALAWGCRTKNQGTSGAFFGKVAAHYGCKSYKRCSGMDAVIACLQGGGLAAVCFGPSKWTGGGHYCVLWKYDGRFYINDPASAKASRAVGTYQEVKQARKAFYCFGKETK